MARNIFYGNSLKKAAIPLECIDDQVPRKHQFVCAGRVITTHSLTAPSGTANRAIGSMPAYKEAKAQDPRYTTFDFRRRNPVQKRKTGGGFDESGIPK